MLPSKFLEENNAQETVIPFLIHKELSVEILMFSGCFDRVD